MNAPRLMNQMELVAYELAVAETAQRKADHHRHKAMRLQAAVYAEFKAALTEAQDRQKTNQEDAA